MIRTVSFPGTRVRNAALATAVPLAATLTGAAAVDQVAWWAVASTAAAAVGIRRAQPWAALVLALAAAGLAAIAPVPPLAAQLSVLVCLYTVASLTPTPIAAAALVAVALLVIGWDAFAAFTGIARTSLHFEAAGEPTEAAGAAPGFWNALMTPLLALVTAWAIGIGVRGQRAHLDTLGERAVALERERDQRAALAVAAERARISREMHDVVAHHLSVMVILAQGAAATLRRRPADAEPALDAVVSTGRTALDDLRSLLGALGERDGPLRPLPCVDDLPELFEHVRRAGTPVGFTSSGAAALPPAISRAAYRIVQESLTNTMKHAGPGTAAKVDFSYGPGEFAVTVTDDGRAPSEPVPGNGLRGMRERVRLLGGRFEAGPGRVRGFSVHAVLPIEGGSR